MTDTERAILVYLDHHGPATRPAITAGAHIPPADPTLDRLRIEGLVRSVPRRGALGGIAYELSASGATAIAGELRR